ERLVSQNRNAVDGISGSQTVNVGQTYQYVLNSHTAPGGYEQLESFLTLGQPIFQLLSVATTYTAPPGATNDKVYADAGAWDTNPTSPTYRSITGPPTSSGGKVGDSIQTVFTVKVLSAGSTNVTGLIYDFSGSSFHYNGDFGYAVLAVTAVDSPPVA